MLKETQVGGEIGWAISALRQDSPPGLVEMEFIVVLYEADNRNPEELSEI